jgi:flavin reductase (DIM6/NTAB) family NADH-FMN oxidoreductase RutF
MSLMSQTPTAEPEIDLLKQVHRRFVTGVTVVTTMADGTPKGLAVNAFSSISLDPPLILVCVQKTSSTYESLFSATHLAVNILSAQQMGVVATFAAKKPDKFAEVDWRPGPYGSPLINGSAAIMEAEICERLQASTHSIFIGRVRHVEVSDAEPVVYSAGAFFHGGHLEPLDPG